MLINYVLLLFLSIHFATTVSVNHTTIFHAESQNPQNTNSTSAPLATLIQAKEGQPKIKLNEKPEQVLSRKIFNTSVVNEPKSIPKPLIKIVTEGSGVSKVNPNDTTSIVVSGVKVNSPKNSPPTISTTTLPPPVVGGSTQLKTGVNETQQDKSKITPTLAPQNKTSVVVVKSSTNSTGATTTTSTTTTSTTTTTTTTTTTPKPKKPTITSAVEDLPELARANAEVNNKFPSETKSSAGRFSVEDPETPHAQPSQELDSRLYRNHRDYIIPIVSIIFAVPILMGMVIVAYRRFKDFWSTRHYRRMDFLVDGMYND